MSASRPRERWEIRLERAIRPHGFALALCVFLADASLHALSAQAATNDQVVAQTQTQVRPAAQAAPTSPSTPSSTPSSAVFTPAFTPGHALPLVLDTIRSARSTLYVAAYSFTSKPIALALRDAQRRGVQVMVLVDAGEAFKGYSAARFLANERVPVRTNARYALQHNKFIVADGTTVQTGSFNYTSSAGDRNAENVLVVSNSPQLAAVYAREWRRLWDEGTELAPAY